jgi:hypothetical protein
MILAIEFFYLNPGEENTNKVERNRSIRQSPPNLDGDGVLREIILPGNPLLRLMYNHD